MMESNQSTPGFEQALNQSSRYLILLSFLIALVAVMVGLVFALQFKSAPFPGFLVEQTLVISNISGEGWTGKDLGLNYPMRVTHLNDIPVIDDKLFQTLIQEMEIGSKISLTVIMPNGQTQDFVGIELMRFPSGDWARLFWLSYGIGIVYLLLGLWVYWLRGGTLVGRTFAYFTIWAAITNLLLFDLWTTHRGTYLWTFAIAQLGGAIIGLAILVPRPIPSFYGRRWTRIFAYGISLTLAAWGMIKIFDNRNPWDYVMPWQASYLFASIGVLIFVTSMVLRLRKPMPETVRKQVLMILWGGLIAFTPIAIWFATQLFLNTPFDPLLLSLVLLIFPVSIAIALVRYRMWDFELIIRRTLIYTLLTGILGMIYLLLVLGVGGYFQKWFGIGNLFSVVATLVIVLIFSPLRNLVGRVVDQWFFRDRARSEIFLHEFEEKLRTQVDVTQVSTHLVSAVEQLVETSEVTLWLPKMNSDDRRQ